MKLVIVESPTKAKTITRFLPKEYKVESSFGHVRDLPKSKLGVDVDDNFTPQYEVPLKARARVTELKKMAKKADTVYLATDEDREGEAIAWHLRELLPKTAKTERITFHEITKEAIEAALAHPRSIDPHLVDSQQARRVLDRLVGYELSPFLWRKIYRGLSAGRVQSVVVRLIVEREREIKAFKPQEYWSIDGLFQKQSDSDSATSTTATWPATLHSINDKKIDKLYIATKTQANQILADLEKAQYAISKIEQKERQRKPLPPFTTSTLQQEANNTLGFSAKQTMMLAQQLYEGVDYGEGAVGLITYMRTDSLNLADKFLQEAQEFITQQFGAKYMELKKYKTKTKGAQEAHEAIRPTNVLITPEQLANKIDARQHKLYDLIWRRAVASQMPAAITKATSVDISASVNTAKPAAPSYVFRATGTQITFDGWLKIFPVKIKENILPPLCHADKLICTKLQSAQHFTEPPPRYTEASMVKTLEEKGIGRPSTYAPTIAIVQDRGYIKKENRQLIPEDIGCTVNDLLVAHFPEIVDYDFTAKMEEQLDSIATEKHPWQPTIKNFYMPFKDHLTTKDQEISKKDVTEQPTDEVCPKCGKPMVIKIGRYGKFLACTGYPECKTTKPLENDRNGRPVAVAEKTDVVCNKCGAPMVRKHGRYGPFLGCSKYPECKNIVNIEDKTGVKCPKCGKGDIVAKRSRAGKTFYACNQYPKCQNAYWSKPTGEKCPQCDSLLVLGAKDTIRCSSKECKYQRTGEGQN